MRGIKRTEDIIGRLELSSFLISDWSLSTYNNIRQQTFIMGLLIVSSMETVTCRKSAWERSEVSGLDVGAWWESLFTSVSVYAGCHCTQSPTTGLLTTDCRRDSLWRTADAGPVLPSPTVLTQSGVRCGKWREIETIRMENCRSRSQPTDCRQEISK